MTRLGVALLLLAAAANCAPAQVKNYFTGNVSVGFEEIGSEEYDVVSPSTTRAPPATQRQKAGPTINYRIDEDKKKQTVPPSRPIRKESSAEMRKLGFSPGSNVWDTQNEQPDSTTRRPAPSTIPSVSSGSGRGFGLSGPTASFGSGSGPSFGSFGSLTAEFPTEAQQSEQPVEQEQKQSPSTIVPVAPASIAEEDGAMAMLGETIEAELSSTRDARVETEAEERRKKKEAKRQRKLDKLRMEREEEEKRLQTLREEREKLEKENEERRRKIEQEKADFEIREAARIQKAKEEEQRRKEEERLEAEREEKERKRVEEEKNRAEEIKRKEEEQRRKEQEEKERKEEEQRLKRLEEERRQEIERQEQERKEADRKRKEDEEQRRMEMEKEKEKLEKLRREAEELRRVEQERADLARKREKEAEEEERRREAVRERQRQHLEELALIEHRREVAAEKSRLERELEDKRRQMKEQQRAEEEQRIADGIAREEEEKQLREQEQREQEQAAQRKRKEKLAARKLELEKKQQMLMEELENKRRELKKEHEEKVAKLKASKEKTVELTEEEEEEEEETPEERIEKARAHLAAIRSAARPVILSRTKHGHIVNRLEQSVEEKEEEEEQDEEEEKEKTEEMKPKKKSESDSARSFGIKTHKVQKSTEYDDVSDNKAETQPKKMGRRIEIKPSSKSKEAKQESYLGGWENSKESTEKSTEASAEVTTTSTQASLIKGPKPTPKPFVKAPVPVKEEKKEEVDPKEQYNAYARAYYEQYYKEWYAANGGAELLKDAVPIDPSSIPAPLEGIDPNVHYQRFFAQYYSNLLHSLANTTPSPSETTTEQPKARKLSFQFGAPPPVNTGAPPGGMAGLFGGPPNPMLPPNVGSILTGIVDPATVGNAEMSKEQLDLMCAGIKGAAGSFGIKDVRGFAKNNCILIQGYYRNVTCEQINHVMEYCYPETAESNDE